MCPLLLPWFPRVPIDAKIIRRRAKVDDQGVLCDNYGYRKYETFQHKSEPETLTPALIGLMQFFIDGQWFMAHGSRLMAHASWLIAHGQ